MGQFLCRSVQFALAMLLAPASAATAVADPIVAAPHPGPMTRQQAENGETVYNDYCAECHRPDLTGAFGPSLMDQTFKSHWHGKPVSDLRDWIRANMPPNAPGTLPDDRLDPIVAWILFKNGVQPGSRPLDEKTAGSPFAE